MVQRKKRTTSRRRTPVKRTGENITTANIPDLSRQSAKKRADNVRQLKTLPRQTLRSNLNTAKRSLTQVYNIGVKYRGKTDPVGKALYTYYQRLHRNLKVIIEDHEKALA